MILFENKIESLKKFQLEKDKIILMLIEDIENVVLDLNIEQMADFGMDGEGSAIEPEYTASTVAIKKAKGQPTDMVTLSDTGDFHKAMFIVYGDKQFAIGSDDPKAKSLERKYGPQIYGLISSNLQQIIELIRPEILIELRKAS